MTVRPVGLLEMRDQGVPDQKILAVPNRDPRFDQIRAIAGVFPHVLREIEHFFNIYKELEGKKTELRGWREVDEARALIRDARAAYLSSYKRPGV
jgi:inorganic pyrophosphatase